MTDQEAHLVFQEPELKVIQEVISQIEKDFGMAGFEGISKSQKQTYL